MFRRMPRARSRSSRAGRLRSSTSTATGLGPSVGQECNASDNPILLRVETKAGHGAGKPTAKQIEESADQYGFVMDRVGMPVTPVPSAVGSRSR